MSVVDEYQRQYAWRDWATAYSLLPIAPGQTVLDLGCGLGDQARDLAMRAAQVIAVDASPELLAAARRTPSPNITYHQADLTALAGLGLAPADGLWCSFAAAYFPLLAARLVAWRQLLKPGAWVALIEADDIFGHTPMTDEDRQRIEQYYAQALGRRLYDFRMGGRLAAHVTAAGLELVTARTLPDREFCFQGSASEGVLDSWERRLSRLSALQSLCGDEYPAFCQRFLATLQDPSHQSRAAVHIVLARVPSDGSG